MPRKKRLLIPGERLQLPALPEFVPMRDFVLDSRQCASVRIKPISRFFKLFFFGVQEEATRGSVAQVFEARHPNNEYVEHAEIEEELGEFYHLTVGELYTLLVKQGRGYKGLLRTEPPSFNAIFLHGSFQVQKIPNTVECLVSACWVPMCGGWNLGTSAFVRPRIKQRLLYPNRTRFILCVQRFAL